MGGTATRGGDNWEAAGVGDCGRGGNTPPAGEIRRPCRESGRSLLSLCLSLCLLSRQLHPLRRFLRPLPPAFLSAPPSAALQRRVSAGHGMAVARRGRGRPPGRTIRAPPLSFNPSRLSEPETVKPTAPAIDLEKLKTLSQWQLGRHRRVLEPLIRQILTNRVLHLRGLADIESFREGFRTACLIVYRTCFR